MVGKYVDIVEDAENVLKSNRHNTGCRLIDLFTCQQLSATGDDIQELA